MSTPRNDHGSKGRSLAAAAVANLAAAKTDTSSGVANDEKTSDAVQRAMSLKRPKKATRSRSTPSTSTLATTSTGALYPVVTLPCMEKKTDEPKISDLRHASGLAVLAKHVGGGGGKTGSEDSNKKKKTRSSSSPSLLAIQELASGFGRSHQATTSNATWKSTRKEQSGKSNHERRISGSKSNQNERGSSKSKSCHERTSSSDRRSRRSARSPPPLLKQEEDTPAAARASVSGISKLAALNVDKQGNFSGEAAGGEKSRRRCRSVNGRLGSIVAAADVDEDDLKDNNQKITRRSSHTGLSRTAEGTRATRRKRDRGASKSEHRRKSDGDAMASSSREVEEEERLNDNRIAMSSGRNITTRTTKRSPARRSKKSGDDGLKTKTPRTPMDESNTNQEGNSRRSSSRKGTLRRGKSHPEGTLKLASDGNGGNSSNVKRRSPKRQPRRSQSQAQGGSMGKAASGIVSFHNKRNSTKLDAMSSSHNRRSVRAAGSRRQAVNIGSCQLQQALKQDIPTALDNVRDTDDEEEDGNNDDNHSHEMGDSSQNPARTTSSTFFGSFFDYTTTKSSTTGSNGDAGMDGAATSYFSPFFSTTTATTKTAMGPVNKPEMSDASNNGNNNGIFGPLNRPMEDDSSSRNKNSSMLGPLSSPASQDKEELDVSPLHQKRLNSAAANKLLKQSQEDDNDVEAPKQQGSPANSSRTATTTASSSCSSDFSPLIVEERKIRRQRRRISSSSPRGGLNSDSRRRSSRNQPRLQDLVDADDLVEDEKKSSTWAR